MVQKFAVAGAVAILGLAGLIQRVWIDRSLNGPAILAAAAKIDQVPMTIDGWQGQPLELDTAETARAGYAGAFWRRYEQAKTGSVVSVLLVCGPPGRVSVHTPDACYAGAGFQMVAEPARTNFRSAAPSGRAEFWKAEFAKPRDPAPAKLRIYYAWSDGDTWQAVDNPRLSFTSLPVLYKLYVVCQATSGGDRQNLDAAQAFMEALLPELQRILREPEAKGV